MSHERRCTMDKKIYRYCPRCSEFKNEPYWKFAYCSENCRTIDIILNDYTFKQCSKEEAKARLEECDLSDVGLFAEKDQKKIAEIMEEPKTRKRRKTDNEESADTIEEENLEV